MLQTLPFRIGRRAAVITCLLACALLIALASPAAAAVNDATRAARAELTAGKAIALGVVEGVTEFLPISSTGHLIVADNLLDIGQHKSTKDAADTYTITIQAGAILAVFVLVLRPHPLDGARVSSDATRRAGTCSSSRSSRSFPPRSWAPCSKNRYETSCSARGP